MNLWRKPGPALLRQASAPFSSCAALIICIILCDCYGQAQTLEQAQREYTQGRYDSAIALAKKKVASGTYIDSWHVLLVQCLLTTGRYAEADTNGLAGVEQFPGSIQLRLLARQTALFQGDTNRANRQLENIKSLIERPGRMEQSGENLVALGNALILLGIEPRLALENCFRKAYNMDPPVREAYLASGQLALNKHDFSLAADSFRAGLKKFPDDPDLEAGLGRAFEPSDRKEMEKALKAALAVNPHHVPSLLLLADHLIDAEQYDDAKKQLQEVLAVNPFSPEANAYLAVLAHLGGDLSAAGKLRAKALVFWSSNPQVDYLIGLKLAQNYLFEDAAAAQQRALEYQTDYVPARRQLAEDLLRLGREEEGWKMVQEARAQDEYDVALYNLSTLHDTMAKFRTLTNSDFTLHMAPEEAQLYGDRALELLERAKTFLCAKYDVELHRPTIVEIFPKQKDFAVRTFGMPGNPGYLGVCFGSVITANSPASQMPNPANWQDVLWHEFCHVVTLTDTRNRMPRWMSEGISVYEERQADPAWGEKMNLAYRERILGGKLTPVGKLSGAFLQANDSESLQFAYFESSLVIQFVVDKFGLPALKQILADLRQGAEINQAIAAHTLPLNTLETQFADFAEHQAQALAGGADLEKPPDNSDDSERLAWAKQHPKNYYLRFQEAEKLLQSKHWKEARDAFDSLAQDYHGESRGQNPLWLEAVAERHLSNTNAELSCLQKQSEREADFVELYLRLEQLTSAAKDWVAEAKYATRLLQINPLLAAPYQALAEASLATGNNPQAIDSYRKLLLLGPADLAKTHFELARLLHAQAGSEQEAKRHVLQALEEAPRYRKAQRLLLEIEASTAKEETSANPTPGS